VPGVELRPTVGGVWVFEFRCLWSDIFNGFVEAGFVIQGVRSDSRHLHPAREVEPENHDHMLSIVQPYFAVLVQKPEGKEK